MAITVEEYKKILSLLKSGDPSLTDLLCDIAYRLLKKDIKDQCESFRYLKGKKYEDDIFQEVCIRISTKIVSSFLLRINLDDAPEINIGKLRAWLFTVERNLVRNYNEQEKRKANRAACSDFDINGIPAVEENEETLEEKRAVLRRAFHIAIESDHGVYKVLAWLAQSLYILETNRQKHKTNDIIIEVFHKKTLYQMFDTVLENANKFPWIAFTSQQIKRINNALNAPHDKKRKYGDVTFEEFFMSKGGKKSLSDWANRLNSAIKQEIKKNDESFNC